MAFGGRDAEWLRLTVGTLLAGLITFVVEGIDAQDLSNRLYQEHNVIIRYVDTYINNPRGNRLSAGFYNDEEDIDRLVEAIASIRSNSFT